eukprot:CAMPEP_0178411408 /NCGR_PEP_ID=MMETSP0689_2-20121128/21479_1 /TAXON_ID=160604 /ORGANISM="Amphidinium massartii, Strain CS-259" /LENGTH=306 /DNA_ID=CAMNT_0020032613 /DNA_START=50 /DNA_END=967 /DNA_ORIENTATION=+
MPMELVASQQALEKVRLASSFTMQLCAPNAQQATSEYVEHRDAPLTNTFLNFIVPEEAATRRRRRSVSCLTQAPLSASAPSNLDDTDSPHVEAASNASFEEAQAAQMTPTCSLKMKKQDSEASASDAETVSSTTTGAGLSSQLTPLTLSERGSDSGSETELRRHRQPQSSAQSTTPSESADDAFTTVMLQNLPQMFSQIDLMQAMDQKGFARTYDFCYMPVTFHDGYCRGYAFINFRTHEAAETLLNEWHGNVMFCDAYHRKPLVATVASTQGLEALLAQPSMKKLQRVRNPAFRPFIARDATAVQ